MKLSRPQLLLGLASSATAFPAAMLDTAQNDPVVAARAADFTKLLAERFLPHNGYATIPQFIDATTNVVGMGPQLAAFLAVLGASLDGDGTSWSIDGTPPAGVGGPLAQQGHGISGSHNKYESDASPTRHDLYESGENYLPSADQFEQLIAANLGGYVTLDGLTQFRSRRRRSRIWRWAR